MLIGWEHGKQIYQSKDIGSITQDVVLITAISNMLAKCGHPMEALSIWKTVHNKVKYFNANLC